MSSTSTNDEEPPLKRNKPPIERTSNRSLPDDLLVSCFARVSRLYYPTLSLVCKRFRSLLTSPELYQTRSLLGRTEKCLYVCLRFSHTDPNPHWFMLCRRPNQTLTNTRKKKKNKKSSEYVLARIPIPHSPPTHMSGLVAVGSDIYNIGGYINNSPSSNVSILSCWSHTWREAPSMRVERAYLSANVLDGKVYATGGCKHYNSSNWMEVFDPKTQTWEPVSSPATSLTPYCCYTKTNNVEVDGKLYIFGDNRVVYNPKDGTWNGLGSEMDLRLNWSSSCVIENVLYYYCYEEGFKWYNTKVRSWRSLKGMKGLPKFACFANVRLADYGGKMALFWDKFVASGGGGGYQNRMIWCAMISLERRNSEEAEEIWGTVEWLDAVLPGLIPVNYVFQYLVTVTV